MITKLFAQAICVVLLAAIVSNLIDPAILRVAVDHIASGLQELVDIGERVGQGETGRQMADAIRNLF